MKTTRDRRSTMVAAAMLMTLGVALGCGSGSGDDGPLVSGSCLDLAGTGGGQSSISLSEGSASSCGVLEVEVVANEIDDIFASSFDLVYDTDLARFESFSTAGSLLTSDGATVQVLVDDQPGRVTLGLTRVGASTGGIDANGSRTLVKLYFSKGSIDAGDGGVEFSNASVHGSESPPVAKSGIAWVDGTFLVN